MGNDPGSRMASYVVSGVGFLGAGVIFKDGGNVRGLNTAATIWCSASIGVLCGFNHLLLAALVGLAVLFTNTVLRPLAYRLHPVLPAAQPSETLYEIVLTCRNTDETHLRALLLTTISPAAMSLQAIHSEDEENSDRTQPRAEVNTQGRKNDVVEGIAMRISIESGITSLSGRSYPLLGNRSLRTATGRCLMNVSCSWRDKSD